MSLKKMKSLENFSVKAPAKKSIDLLLASKFIWEQALIKVDVSDWWFAAARKCFHL